AAMNAHNDLAPASAKARETLPDQPSPLRPGTPGSAAAAQAARPAFWKALARCLPGIVWSTDPDLRIVPGSADPVRENRSTNTCQPSDTPAPPPGETGESTQPLAFSPLAPELMQRTGSAPFVARRLPYSVPLVQPGERIPSFPEVRTGHDGVHGDPTPPLPAGRSGQRRSPPPVIQAKE